jgi:predicted alpha/beta hydrolase
LVLTEAKPVQIICGDGTRLGGHVWEAASAEAVVVINPATGVLASYYHRYARFLAAQGFTALTYDYRGIGESRPQRLHGMKARWADWGTKDFAAALDFALGLGGRVMAVGHSVGGYLPGLADNAPALTRILAVGGQYGYWGDYVAAQRAGLFAKWHVAMPALAALYGYFPGKKLGWLEDLPKGVALDWALHRARMEAMHPPRARAEVLARFAAVTAPILAVTMSDDEFATPQAIRRTLAYYTGAPKEAVMLHPRDLGHERIGHFGLFHGRHAGDFWPATVAWLRGGDNPWPGRGI